MSVIPVCLAPHASSDWGMAVFSGLNCSMAEFGGAALGHGMQCTTPVGRLSGGSGSVARLLR